MRERAAALLRACLTRICLCVAPLTSCSACAGHALQRQARRLRPAGPVSRRRRPARTRAENQRWRCLAAASDLGQAQGPAAWSPTDQGFTASRKQRAGQPTECKPPAVLPPPAPTAACPLCSTASCFATGARRNHTSSALLCGPHEGASSSDHSLSPSSLTTHVCGRNLECRHTSNILLHVTFFPDTCWQKPTNRQTPSGHVCH